MRDFVIPISTPSLTNQREHWSVKARRAKEQRRAAYLLWRANSRECCDARHKRIGCTVTLTRFGGRTLDNDNLRAALKSIRDGIADAIGLDDGDARLEWIYQQKPRVKAWGIPNTDVPLGVLVGVSER